jgi:NAD(P)H-dependent FMN reductase
MTPILLNIFCWASRPSPTDDFGAVFQGKPVALMASSLGRLGGVRVIPRLRDAVCELGMVPVPGFASIGNAAQAFSDNGELSDKQQAQGLNALIQRLVTHAG